MKEKLTFNMLMDLRKKEVNEFERAKLIKNFLKVNKMSIRQLARETGIHRSTLEDWLLWNRMTKTDYRRLLHQGVTHAQIYRTLRERKKEPKEEIVDITQLDSDLMKSMMKLKSYFTDFNLGYVSPRTVTNIEKLQNLLNRLLMKIEQGEKKSRRIVRKKR